ncbi:hypothetical protein ACQZ5N_25485 [Agrobacterium sp. 22-221-1]
MKINLSKHQRYAALAAAAVILIVLYVQISEEGFDGYGWVLALVVALALVILGLGPVGTAPPPPLQEKKPAVNRPTPQELEVMHQKLRDNAEVLAIEVEERAKIIAQNILASQPQELRFVGEDGGASPVVAGLESFIRDRSLLFSLGLVGIRQTTDYQLYVTGIEYKDTEKRVFDIIAREQIAGMMAMGLPVDKDKLLPPLLKDLQAIRKCVVLAAEANKRGDSDASAPLVAWLAAQGMKITDDNIIRSALQK